MDVVVLNKSRDAPRTTLNVGHVGDSGVIVVRGKKTLLMTQSQQHGGNCPYQLVYGEGVVGDSLLAAKHELLPEVRISGGGTTSSPSHLLAHICWH
jgi:hypothetical protein